MTDVEKDKKARRALVDDLETEEKLLTQRLQSLKRKIALLGAKAAPASPSGRNGSGQALDEKDDAHEHDSTAHVHKRVKSVSAVGPQTLDDVEEEEEDSETEEEEEEENQDADTPQPLDVDDVEEEEEDEEDDEPHNEEEEEENEDADVEIQGQYLGRAASGGFDDSIAARQRRAAYAESGIIKKIVLQNFLCHEHFELSFHPNVNFIHGANGSGKSAVVVGLQTVFGSRASETNRGSSLKELVQWGKTVATVTVTIKNEGDDAYDHDRYGDEVRIQRNIRRGPGGGYKLFNSRGRIVSRKRDELMRVLDHFNIQITNPCVIMNQDTSREFLQPTESNARDKYNFFEKATLLERIQTTLVESHVTRNIPIIGTVLFCCSQRARFVVQQDSADMTKQIEEKEAAKADEARKLQRYKVENDTAVGIENKQKQVTALRELLVWTHVYDAKKAMIRQQKRVKDIEQQQKQLRAKIKRYEQTSYEDELKALKEKSKEFTERSKQQAATVSAVKKTAIERQTVVKRLRRTKTNIAMQHKQILEEISAKKSQIAGFVEQDACRDTGQELQAWHRTLKQLEAKKASLEEETKAMQDKLEEAEEALDANKREARQAARMAQGVKRRIDRATSDLDRLNAKKRNKLAVFGRHTHEILRAIQKHKRRFSRLPEGPIGRFIVARKEEWTKAVEVCCGWAMGAYLVANHSDARLLQKIFDDLRIRDQRPGIITQAFSDSVYDTSRALKFRTTHPTVWSLMEVSSPWVSCALIDQCAPECWLAVDDKNRGFDLCKQHARTRFRGVITKSGGRVERRGMSTSWISNYTRRSYLQQGDSKEEHRRIQEDIQRNRDEMAKHQRAVEDYERKREPLRIAAVNCKKAVRALNKKHSEMNVKIEDLVLSKPETADTDVMEEHEEEIAGLNEECEKLAAQMEQNKAALKEATEKSKEADTEYKTQKRKLEELVEATQKITNKRNQVLQEYSRAHLVLDEKRKADRLATKGLREATLALEDCKRQYEERLKAVTQWKSIEEIPQNKVRWLSNRPALEKRILVKEEEVKATTETLNGLDVETVKLRYYNARQRLNEIGHSLEECKAKEQSLRASLRVTTKQLRAFRVAMAKSSRHWFHFYLQKQNHGGVLRFNHKENTLSIEVTPSSQVSQGDSAAMDTGSLSGGERAFATLAFCMALGESMQAPFRCFDEYDVFMDSLNRRISMNMLLGVAADSRNRQYIFITPHDVSSIPSSPHISVFKLAPPARGQRTLPFRPHQRNQDDEHEE